MKFPLGIQTFEKIRQGGWVYVDKTRFVYELSHGQQYNFLSRPRRFGKSLLLSTLHAYFSGKKHLFKGLEIEHLEKEWITYPVFHFDLNTGSYGKNPDAVTETLSAQLHIFEEKY